MNESAAAADTSGTAKIIYILYLVGPITGGLTYIVGVVMAYVYQGTAPDWLKTHYRFQIRTFWIMVVYCVLSLLFAATIILIPIAWLIGIFILVWLIIRCVKGMQSLDMKRAHP
ncbi:MAG: hypothetical protein PVF75_08625, partial [Granulosicoccaceae bacterium]